MDEANITPPTKAALAMMAIFGLERLGSWRVIRCARMVLSFRPGGAAESFRAAPAYLVQQ